MLDSGVIVFAVVLAVILIVIIVATRRAGKAPPVKPLPKAEEAPPAVAVRKRKAEEEAAPEEEPEEEAEEEAEQDEAARAAAKQKELRAGLAKTRGGFIAKISALLGKKSIDADTMDQLEEALLTADIGVKTSQKIFDTVKKELSRDELGDADKIWANIRAQSEKILDVGAPPLDLDRATPFVVLIIGVNGVGKTTTIGKLAAKYSRAGKKVLLAAGDTFRAAATEQLEIWGQRTGVPVVKGKEGGDPSSVIFDAVKKAQAEGYDVVIGDTAGRLHTKTDLMQELQKVRRVVGKAMDGAPHETFLVVDSTTGQNAIAQAQLFQQAMALTGIILTKLDGTAKGGVILGICDELKLPVRYIGIGEKVDDLREFDPRDFVAALYERDDSQAA
jgi:fused signal recognition particle receptor